MGKGKGEGWGGGGGWAMSGSHRVQNLMSL